MSGAVGVSVDGEVPPGVVEHFARWRFDAYLRTAGSRPEHVVKVNIYLTNIADRAPSGAEGRNRDSGQMDRFCSMQLFQASSDRY